MTYVRYPPRWRNILVPLGPRRNAALGMTLYTACRPLPLAAHRALWAAARLAGPRVLPGPRETWTPDVPDPVWRALVEQWSAAGGGRPTGFAIYSRIQASRQALVLLLCTPTPMLVRVRPDDTALSLEQRVSAAANADGVGTAAFRVPRVVGSGEADGWHWLGYELMATRPHAPVGAVGAAALAQISRIVDAVLPRPADVPAHWQGAHGDLTPWNFRRAGGRDWLIDWEDVGWAPPGADAVFFAANTAALRDVPSGPLAVDPAHEEARRYWFDRVAARRVEDGEVQLQQRLLTLLGDHA
ncbi:MAG: phosphotransferase [Jatrophihabitans sp.]|uniref:phosphotransferase n=1 Tax=Jatrophihabitans sp. TaxID=1932789 RepID=UPI003F7D0943